ncbi:ABC transporter substrate-binding protein [Haloechinothrix sp. LS1_15]|uniref:ABC transporter substrate-binding protein n=1 Tax=Haloechinothrix sp. LS1_15 TaxID=2652248 RepID=UPI0029450B1F|nr:ABC transporter substrate-binding protein [Haloechinothrix sp. LS1_15]MDV6012902.1 ABC transporter substrate-binding protein [Haloechinothrix sp. LS1_15]
MTRSRSRSRTSPLAVAALLVTLQATACFGAPSGGDGIDAGDGGQLSVGLAFPPAQGLSPYGDDAVLLSRLGVVEPVAHLDGAGEPVPALAEDWERVADRTWRFTLRDGVTFHDSTPLTAEHAANSLLRASEASPIPRALKGIELSVSVVDDLILEVSTGEPDPILPRRLSSPNLAILAPSAYRGERVDPVGAGTGPFVIDEFDGVERATLVAHEEHWRGRPALDGIEARFVPDGATRAAGVRAGELDVADALPVAQAQALGEAELVEVQLPRVVSLYPNTADGPMADAGLRAAVRQAVDAEELTSSIFEGTADPAAGLFGDASPWAADRELPERTRPGSADGEELTLATYSDRAELPELATAIGDRLRREGFEVSQVVREYSELEVDLLDGAFDLVIGSRSYLLDTGDPVSYLASDFTCAGSYNLSRVCDSDVDAEVAEAATREAVDERQDAALRVERAILGDDLIVPIAHERARIGVADGVTGIAEDPHERLLVTGETTLE